MHKTFNNTAIIFMHNPSVFVIDTLKALRFMNVILNNVSRNRILESQNLFPSYSRYVQKN